jgi:hypothetical protein
MIRPPVKVIGYIDDSVIYTKDQDMSFAQNNLQKAMNPFADWIKNFGFHISIDKTMVMHICKKGIRNHEVPRIILGNRVL